MLIYSAVVENENGTKFIVASARLSALTPLLFPKGVKEVATFVGSELVGAHFAQPLSPTNPSPVLSADHVELETGTGLVHTAPGHGLEDYFACRQAGIKPFSPVDESGKFTEVSVAFLAFLTHSSSRRLVLISWASTCSRTAPPQ
jgi:isoleucyl-tRNA synthetase